MDFKILLVSAVVVLYNELTEGRTHPYAKISRSKRQAAECIPRGDALDNSMCDRVIPIPDEIRQEFSLDPFYYNYTHAYGIPILSSGVVSLEAMQRACYTVRFMLADRKDVRDAMHDNCARVSIIGLNELTNQIPEYSYFDDSENDRARGIGGTLNNPVSTAGEENLLCLGWQQDRWFTEDIGVHEFAHAIHKIGLNTVYSDFTKQRLKPVYKAAIAKGLWASTYAGSNAQEYFAEGVQKFFEVDVVQEYTDGIHNNISNRMELHDYDLELYSLMVETFPCKHRIVSRCDDQALIESQPLTMNCDSALVTVRTTTSNVVVGRDEPTTEDVTTESVEPSTDGVSTIITTTMLPERESTTVTEAVTTESVEPSTDGVSTIITTTMLPERESTTVTEAVTTESVVPSTDGVSTIITTTILPERELTTVTETVCSDQYYACKIYKTVDRCKQNKLIRRICRSSCELCDVCDNFHPKCEAWYKKGFCETNRSLMKANCKKKCGFC